MTTNIEQNEQTCTIKIGDCINVAADGYPDGLQFLVRDLQVNRRAHASGKVFGFYDMPRNYFVGITHEDGTSGAYTLQEVQN